MTSTGHRIFLYAHDGCGLGHLRRQLTIAGAVSRKSPGTAVLLATGVDDRGPFPVPAGVEVLKIPGLVKVATEHYVPRRLALAAGDTSDLRAGLLDAAVEHFRPDVLLADKHPLGPSGELTPALERLRADGGRALLGVRDVLDDPTAMAAEWEAAGLQAAFTRFYDGALLYGTRSLLDPVAEAGIPPSVLRRGTWCGHVVAPPGPPQPAADPPGDGRPLVVGCAGGGDDGARLLCTFIEASRDAEWRAVVVIGPLAPERDRQDVEAAARLAGVEVHRTITDLGRYLPRIGALVCMGGYNTLLEAAATATPVVCVPRSQPRSEQLIRARAFADRGLLHLVEPGGMTAGALARGVGAALEVPRAVLSSRVARHLDLGGADRAAEHLLGLCTGRHDDSAVTA